jgi:tRNA (guanine9-N1)-methyltransferase
MCCACAAPAQVITVNQVAHIMLKYLECKDWAKTFLEVIPQRKVTDKAGKAAGKGPAGPGQVRGGGPCSCAPPGVAALH